MPEALRVLHVVPSLRPDGAERIAVHIVTGLDKRRFRPAIVSISEEVGSDLERVLANAGIEVWYLGKKGTGFDARMYPRIHQVFRAFRPNVLHTHLDVLRYALPSTIYFRPQLIVHTVHNIAEFEMEWHGRLLQRAAYGCGMIPIAVAGKVARSVERLYRLDRCDVISNGVPTETFRKPRISRSEWRVTHGFGEDEVLFVCVARLTQQKNHALLLNAFAKACVADRRARLVLVGTGDFGPKLQDEVQRLGLVDRVHFMGRRTDIPELLGAMDVFVLSSDWEGNPVSLMEAMSAGLPVISTAVGGVPEVFRNGVEGFLVQPGDTLGFSKAMASLLQDGDARRSMGAAGSTRAKTQFNVAEMASAYQNIYERESLLDEHCISESTMANSQSI